MAAQGSHHGALGPGELTDLFDGLAVGARLAGLALRLCLQHDLLNQVQLLDLSTLKRHARHMVRGGRKARCSQTVRVYHSKIVRSGGTAGCTETIHQTQKGRCGVNHPEPIQHRERHSYQYVLTTSNQDV